MPKYHDEGIKVTEDFFFCFYKERLLYFIGNFVSVYWPKLLGGDSQNTRDSLYFLYKIKGFLLIAIQ